MRWVALALVLMLSSPGGANELEGSTVVLAITYQRQDDRSQQLLERQLGALRRQVGLSPDEMPIVFLGFQEADCSLDVLKRLGVTCDDGPLVCIVEWGPEQFGPRRVLEGAIARHLDPQDDRVAAMVATWLRRAGQADKIALLPRPQTPDLPSAQLAPALDEAVGAFVEGRYGEPDRDNAIELTLAALRGHPDPAAIDLLERSVVGFEDQARGALHSGDRPRAAQIFRRLAVLFPDRPSYAQAAVSLASPARELLIGNWSYRSKPGRASFAVSKDFTCQAHWFPESGAPSKEPGTWRCLDPEARLFEIRWRWGNVTRVRLSSEGDSFNSEGLLDGPGEGRRKD
ncbi:MAG: hypothetical protein KC910_00105 [Candidatus Eremiobacteraeota bacterium]|nr:hypothetical protein [Candidatus Eremiobacteraeota bacterium]